METVDLSTMETDLPVLPERTSYEVTSKQSLIMRLVPQLVESRIPQVPSIRSSITRLRTPKDSENLRLRSPSSPPSYSDRQPPNESIIEVEEGSSDMSCQAALEIRPSSSRSSTLPTYQETETSSGINWRFATQGAPTTRHRPPIMLWLTKIQE
jgi:hypothetical protein